MPTPMTYTEVITGVFDTIGDLGLWGFVSAGLLLTVSIWAFKRLRK